ncbi:small hydrophobic protein [Jingmen Apodemus agrarius jeilongvirus 2]|uniref:Small hydrophobic protein n=1 Tax=Mus musculus jeilongvirus TaxID=3049974 RepID=A0A9Y2E4P3_9MONO|nr:small hydrophobic protein [Jingmen Apodemus agrarius jeilongvirus 2]WIU81511.1 small hydrophobic protein [Mus musculus jeilongvirus]WKD80563.1 small hydrophobic protein [Jingmen Apodemus agrarius jeilongvirus 2]WPV62474.1 MAG: small hydrophobic protein [Jun jeilongvirus]
MDIDAAITVSVVSLIVFFWILISTAWLVSIEMRFKSLLLRTVRNQRDVSVGLIPRHPGPPDYSSVVTCI